MNKEIPLLVFNVVSKFFKSIIVVCEKRKENLIRKILGKVKTISLEKFSFKRAMDRVKKVLKKDFYFLVSSNMPFLMEKTVREILVRFDGKSDCICYFWSLKNFEKFCAIYSRRFLPNFRACKRKILVPIGKETYEFFKVNTQEDLKEAKEILRSKWGRRFLMSIKAIKRSCKKRKK